MNCNEFRKWVHTLPEDINKDLDIAARQILRHKRRCPKGPTEGCGEWARLDLVILPIVDKAMDASGLKPVNYGGGTWYGAEQIAADAVNYLAGAPSRDNGWTDWRSYLNAPPCLCEATP